jgi:choline dehydrogenase
VSSHDVVIVGAGTSGCALAARLSEDPKRRVLLLEAGPAWTDLAELPPELARSGTYGASFPGHPNNWSFIAELGNGRNHPMPRGKAAGGSSAINGTYFVRGRPQDFAGWAEQGNELWSWDRVLPYFLRCESDHDFRGELHGSAGPVPVARPGTDELRPVSRAFVDACRAAGYADDPDKNGAGPAGIGPIPRNSIDGVRMSTALTYLRPCAGRGNLTLVGGAEVQRVLFEGKRAVGVEARVDGKPLQFHGAEIVLSAGAINSPRLLMLSGVGPEQDLQALGIPVVLDRAGVGQHAMDHPVVHVLYRARSAVEIRARPFHPLQTCLNYASSLALGAGGEQIGEDMQITCAAATLKTMLARPRGSAHPVGWKARLRATLATARALARLPLGFLLAQGMAQHDLRLSCTLHRQRSVGELRLRSAKADDAPILKLNYLSHPDDLPRLREIVRIAAGLLESAPFRALDARIVAPSTAALASDAELDRWIDRNLSTQFHTACTARMGPSSDPAAVVDQRCRVHGLQGLRVVDISIMPTIVSRGTAATAVMIGERAADLFD